MIVVLVYVHVNEDAVDAFNDAAEENARNSINEPGIARFDVIQQLDDPRRFILVEVYRSQEAQAAHKETAHYARLAGYRRPDDGRAAGGSEAPEYFPGRLRVVAVVSEWNLNSRRLHGSYLALDLSHRSANWPEFWEARRWQQHIFHLEILLWND